MLIKITNYCSMGCSHCLENSTVAEAHMSLATFREALDLTLRLEHFAWSAGIPPVIHLSGGECTEHPDLFAFIAEVQSRHWGVSLLTNGMWLDNPELRAVLLRPELNLYIQVTNDSRYYPKRPRDIPSHPRMYFRDALSHIIPLGRAARRKHELPVLPAPASFNLRSITRSTGDVRAALFVMRTRAMEGKGGSCSPSISNDGTLTAGDSNLCFPIGNVESTAVEVTQNLLNMGSCNRCSLESRLPSVHKRALGLS